MSPSVYNWFALLMALLTGAAAGVTARRLCDRRAGEFGAVLAAAAVGAALSFVSIVVVLVAAGVDGFAVVHLVYLVAVVGVPLTGALVLVRWRRASAWFRGLVVASLLPVPLGLYATHVEPFWLRTDHVVLDGIGVAAPIRIGVLSDLQTTEVGDYEREAVDRLLATDPDVVVIPGDLYQLESDDDFVRTAPGFRRLLAQITDQVPSVLAVSGNTDSVAGLRAIAEGTGVVVLDNETVDVAVNGTLVRVLGITLDGNENRLVREFDAITRVDESEKPVLSMVLAHQPDEAFRFGGVSSPDVLIAGHTHGGQIAIPGLGPPVTLSSVPRSVAGGGLGEVNGFPVYVSTGVGRERGYAPQVRFGVRPSIGVIDVGDVERS